MGALGKLSRFEEKVIHYTWTSFLFFLPETWTSFEL